MRFKQFYTLNESVNKLNVSTLPLKKAREYAESVKKDVDSYLPDFDKNYSMLQKKMQAAKNIKRIDMPVIEPEDMDKFKEALNKGKLDIFKPIAKDEWKKLANRSNEQFPKDLEPNKGGKEWVDLGLKDGNKTDDVVKAKMTKMKARTLLPLQKEIWLEKLITNIAKWGAPKPGSPVTKTTIIVTKEGYILDGHHRFGQALLSDPNLKMNVLHVPIDIDTLAKAGRSYGNAIGNKQKQ